MTYPLPTGTQCDYTSSNPFDGYTISLGSKGLYPAASGFSGCQGYGQTAFAAELKVLPDGGELLVEPFRCTVTDGIVDCAYTDGLAEIRFGLSTATFSG